MSKEAIISGVAGFVLGVLIAPMVTPLVPWGGGMMYRDSTMSGTQMMGQIDSHFFEQMIPHHEDAIIMANLAFTRAEHSEIKTLAAGIIRAQSEEIDRMKGWYKSWFGKEVPNLNFAM